MNIIRRFIDYFKGKSVKQRICIIIIIIAAAVFTFFMIKGNFFDYPQTEETENDLFSFHISPIDVIVVFVALAAYAVHKIRELIKQRRL